VWQSGRSSERTRQRQQTLDSVLGQQVAPRMPARPGLAAVLLEAGEAQHQPPRPIIRSHFRVEIPGRHAFSGREDQQINLIDLKGQIILIAQFRIDTFFGPRSDMIRQSGRFYKGEAGRVGEALRVPFRDDVLDRETAAGGYR
jgi:hypothetical protein